MKRFDPFEREIAEAARVKEEWRACWTRVAQDLLLVAGGAVMGALLALLYMGAI